MFWAALAAQYAGETHVRAHRVVAALIRTPAVRSLCLRAQLDPDRVRDAADDPHTLSFAECESRIEKDLAERGVTFLSKEHQAELQLRPLDPAVNPVFDREFARQGRLVISPLSLLYEIVRSDVAIAARLASQGLTIERLEEEVGNASD
jgi:hypothetical protein